MRCSECNEIVPDPLNSFCVECGEPLGDDATTVITAGRRAGNSVALVTVAVTIICGLTVAGIGIVNANRAASSMTAVSPASASPANTRQPNAGPSPVRIAAEFDQNGQRLRAICRNGQASYWQADRWATCLLKGGVAHWNPDHPGNQ